MKPWELYALTPGEFADLLEAQNWQARMQKRAQNQPMSPHQRAEQLKILEKKLGEHR